MQDKSIYGQFSVNTLRQNDDLFTKNPFVLIGISHIAAIWFDKLLHLIP